MSSRKYNDLLTLKQNRSDWKIKVRVIRTWRGATKAGEYYKSFNVMLMDHKENKIHGFVPAKCADDLEIKLKVGSVCSITNFDVQPYKSEDKFRCTQNENHLVFNNNTKVKDVEEKGTTIANESFDFYDHTDLDSIKNLNVYLTDVIGIIKNRGDITLKELVNRLGHKNLQTKFVITNGSSNVNVTLWDAMAKSFFQQLILQPLEEAVIIIITSCKVGTWNDEVDLSNAASTTFYLNYQHHSVAEMRKMLDNPNFKKLIHNTKTKKTAKLLNVVQLKNLGNDFIQAEVITHANIRYVDDKAPWYYRICTGCMEEIQFKGGDYICSKCNRRIPEPEKRYKLSILGSDATGVIEICLHDREVRTLLGERAETVHQQQKGCTSFPKQIKTLENTDITVKLLITEENILNKESVYNANNICKGFYIPEDEEPQVSTSNQQTTTHQSTSSYHIDGMSELDFQSPKTLT
ncbi:hypothetical protein POM88_007251 [Heracleum sosnowskyi]|uniref:Replication factor A C-terminal domain-containing protein n=1 Tax=Heracleum sosnowskyi TaxID=360622 RepID=A0AAD8J520_9APIA|nr:hypothetical protein POM88_007251 [Heracleum sosnowskyi]